MQRSLWSVGGGCVLAVSAAFAGCSAAPDDPQEDTETTSQATTSDFVVDGSDLLAPAPRQPVGWYDHLGELLSPASARARVAALGLDPNDAQSYPRVGMVQITNDLIARGRDIFINRKVGDRFGLQSVMGFGRGFASILPEIGVSVLSLLGRPTDNLVITLQKDVRIGSRVLPRGTRVPTGLDVEAGALFPIGVKLDGDITCAVCHAAVDRSTGKMMLGVPNGDVNAAVLIALAPNSTAAFARLKIDPLDPKYQSAKSITIRDSKNRLVRLPDPEIFERAFDDLLLEQPPGHFESSPDGISNTTQIPSVFTLKSGPFTASGEFFAGPFAGLSMTNNAVHSSEINLLAAAQSSELGFGVDPEVYLAVILQNAATPLYRYRGFVDIFGLRVPIKPSQWLRLIAPNADDAELEDQIPAPGTGTYPTLSPSLVTYNGLIFTPKSGNQADIASGPFMFAVNAMSAFQNSLVPPPNRTAENRLALSSGSVARGARVFQRANCASCHPAPFFTDNRIHPIETIGTNPARAQSRLGLESLLVPPKLYSFDTPVPPPPGARVLDVPTAGISSTPTSLPIGLQPNGGYKTTSLRGLFLSAPYLHDGGVAVLRGALVQGRDGRFVPASATGEGLGIPFTIAQSKPADPASSLRALVDRRLRAAVVAVNKSVPSLVAANLDGTGHTFWVDPDGGFTVQDQTDLVNFLLALDDDPGRF